MGWTELKVKSDEEYKDRVKITGLQERWKVLNDECIKKYKQFNIETEEAKQKMEIKAIEGFKKYFESIGFIVSGDNSCLIAKYNDIDVNFCINSGHLFGIHFYVGNILQKCRYAFGLQIAKQYDEKYRQIHVDEIKNNSKAFFAEKLIDALESNKKSIISLIHDKDKIRYVYEFESKYSGISGQFDNIEEILDLLVPE